MPELNTILVAIRSSGERTEQACIESVLGEGFSRDQIHIIREVPFKKALEECFTIAKAHKIKWLLTLDADMILLPNVLEKFHKEAEKMPDHFIQIQGQVLDKFYGEVRRGGPRYYRTEHLSKALNISQSLNDHIRPETNIIQKMGSSGHPSRYISSPIALHDFGQYYSDIYRKARIYAVKHISRISVILEQAKKNKSSDNDYSVIIKGVFDGLSDESEASIDKRLFVKEAEKALKDLNLVEKPTQLESFKIKDVLNKYKLDGSKTFLNLVYKDVPSTRTHLVRNFYKNRGLLRSLIYFTGTLLSQSGNYLLNKNRSK